MASVPSYSSTLVLSPSCVKLSPLIRLLLVIVIFVLLLLVLLIIFIFIFIVVLVVSPHIVPRASETAIIIYTHFLTVLLFFIVQFFVIF